MNLANLSTLISAIEQHPDNFNPNFYHLGRQHCVAGLCQLLSLGLSPTTQVYLDSDYNTNYLYVNSDEMSLSKLGNASEIESIAMNWLEIDQYFERERKLFTSEITLEKLKEIQASFSPEFVIVNGITYKRV